MAPARYADEALSAWLVRIAHAHYLTLDEFLRLSRLCPSSLDQGDPGHIAALATMIGTTVERPMAIFPPRPATSRLAADATWLTCPFCLEQDAESGRSPYIRQAWVHPLATYCLDHEAPLSFQWEGDWFGKIFRYQLEMFRVSPSRYLDSLTVHEVLRFRALALRLRRPATKSTHRKIQEICDVVAVLALPSRRGFNSVIDSLNLWRRGRQQGNRRPQFDPELVWSLEGPVRLGFLCAALSLLARPARRVAGRVRHGFGSRRFRRSKADSAGRAAIDPLIVLADALSAETRAILTARSAGWRSPIRARWAMAESLVSRL